MARSATSQYSIGLHFGLESVRVVVVDIRTGRIARQTSQDYAHGVIDQSLPGSGARLPSGYALQHPRDWLDAASAACRQAMLESDATADQVIGIGVAFTSCTILPCQADGTPLCLTEKFKNVPLAWPKLPTHRTAMAEADRMNAIAQEQKEPWLARYGGIIGIDWFFPKMLETLNHEPATFDAAAVWVEGGDWLVWQLIDGPYPSCKADSVIRSICQAGFKALWNNQSGYPPRAYFEAVHPKLDIAVETTFTGILQRPGSSAGELTEASAKLLGLKPGITVSSAIIDSHAIVPGAGVAAPSTLVMVMGERPSLLMNSRIEAIPPGVAGVVEDGILEGYIGYEIRDSSVGNALTDEPSMEAAAFRIRSLCDAFRDAGVPVRRFVAVGDLPEKSPQMMQIYADVLDARIKLAASDQPIALGAAILGCIAADSGHASISQAIHAMAPERKHPIYRPDLRARRRYDELYEKHRPH
ncbi:MAG TPA: FGGY-family carbohydrate kinase [Tepidisphaeraceae bacterium]